MASGTILVADDDAAIRTVLNQALSRAGYEVRSAGDGQQGLELALTLRPDGERPAFLDAAKASRA